MAASSASRRLQVQHWRERGVCLRLRHHFSLLDGVVCVYQARCLNAKGVSPGPTGPAPGGNSNLQLWAKPQPGGVVTVLVLSNRGLSNTGGSLLLARCSASGLRRRSLLRPALHPSPQTQSVLTTRGVTSSRLHKGHGVPGGPSRPRFRFRSQPRGGGGGAIANAPMHIVRAGAYARPQFPPRAQRPRRGAPLPSRPCFVFVYGRLFTTRQRRKKHPLPGDYF
jgi:hypothetical protein